MCVCVCVCVYVCVYYNFSLLVFGVFNVCQLFSIFLYLSLLRFLYAYSICLFFLTSDV